MYEISEEKMVICPYNSHHVVSKLRIQKHMMKCKRNNPDVKLVTCFYNYSHRLKPEDLLAHYEICSHKTRLDSARYSEGVSCPSLTAAIRGLRQNSFPDINTKTQFFSDTPSYPTQRKYEDSQKLYTSDSDFKLNNFQLKSGNITSKTTFPRNDEKDDDENKVELSASDIELLEDNSDIDFDDDLEPLPLPKTVSKAFVISKEEPNKSFTEKPTSLKTFARGKTLLAFSDLKKLRPIDHQLPDLSKMSIKPLDKEKSLKKVFQNSCSASAASSTFDDISTLKSEEVIFDDELDADDGSKMN